MNVTRERGHIKCTELIFFLIIPFKWPYKVSKAVVCFSLASLEATPWEQEGQIESEMNTEPNYNICFMPIPSTRAIKLILKCFHSVAYAVFDFMQEKGLKLIELWIVKETLLVTIVVILKEMLSSEVWPFVTHA